jgi:biotin transport system substrate-specific component
MATTITARGRWYAPLAPSLPARRALGVVAGSLFLAACSHLSVPLPWTPVPMTMQPFAVLLLGLMFEPSLAAATLVAYLGEGAAGLPVFTPGGVPGLAHLFGPTGGYLLCYPYAAALASALFRSGALRSFGRALAAALAGELLILTAGACWLALVAHRAAPVVLHAAVLPFLPGDALKVILAAALASTWAHSRARTWSQIVEE